MPSHGIPSISRNNRPPTRGALGAIILTVYLILLALSPILHAASPMDTPADPRMFVFISSSMPKGSLVDIAKDSAAHNAPLLLRGLVGDSLQETLLNLRDLAATGAGLEVDPLLFEAYNVQAVPAIVLTCGNRGEGPFAITYGLAPSQALPVLQKLLPAC